MNSKIKTIVATLLLASGVSAFAAETCDKGSYMDTFNFCLDSVYPYRIAGQDTFSSSNDEVEAPPGAHTNSWCKCGEEPYAYYGTPSGYWEPARIVEVVRHPECSPTQGMQAEMQLKMMNKVAGELIRQAEGSQSKLGSIGQKARENYDEYGSEQFLHFHSWPVPDEVLDMVIVDRTQCADMARNASNSLETSITNLAWNASGNNRLLMNLYYPEYYYAFDPIENKLGSAGNAITALVTAMRPVSCAINTTGVGLMVDDYAYMLGGCFDNTLPTSGHHNANDTLSATHNILQRSLMLSARTGGYASLQTVHEGIDQVLCNPVPVMGFPKKSHYKFTMLFPYKESEESDGDDNDGNIAKSDSIMQGNIKDIGNSISSAISDKVTGQVMDWLGVGKTKCAHRFGASKTQWGAKRHSQGDENAQSYEEITSNKDHDAAYMVWRWVDCCWE